MSLQKLQHPPRPISPFAKIFSETFILLWRLFRTVLPSPNPPPETDKPGNRVSDQINLPPISPPVKSNTASFDFLEGATFLFPAAFPGSQLFFPQTAPPPTSKKLCEANSPHPFLPPLHLSLISRGASFPLRLFYFFSPFFSPNGIMLPLFPHGEDFEQRRTLERGRPLLHPTLRPFS